jgi:HEPN domain-containing protein
MLGAGYTDLKALRHMPDVFVFDERIFGFHAQRTCEKSLNAWLLHLGGNRPFIHDLRALIHMLAGRGVTVPEAEAIAPLAAYATQDRYGDEPMVPLDRPATVALCERLYTQVEGLEKR